MEIKVYTTSGCFYCEQMKELCKRAELEYTAIDIPQDELKEMFPNAQGYPWVVIDGEEIGGLVDAAKKFVKEGLVSSGKR